MKKITEWQCRLPEDRNSEDGWMDQTEAGATHLQTECGAEVRTRTVTEWTRQVIPMKAVEMHGECDDCGKCWVAQSEDWRLGCGNYRHTNVN